MCSSADLGIALFSGNGGLKSVGVNVGTWTSLNTGDAGLNNLVNGKFGTSPTSTPLSDSGLEVERRSV